MSGLQPGSFTFLEDAAVAAKLKRDLRFSRPDIPIRIITGSETFQQPKLRFGIGTKKELFSDMWRFNGVRPRKRPDDPHFFVEPCGANLKLSIHRREVRWAGKGARVDGFYDRGPLGVIASVPINLEPGTSKTIATLLFPTDALLPRPRRIDLTTGKRHIIVEPSKDEEATCFKFTMIARELSFTHELGNGESALAYAYDGVDRTLLLSVNPVNLAEVTRSWLRQTVRDMYSMAPRTEIEVMIPAPHDDGMVIAVLYRTMHLLK